MIDLKKLACISIVTGAFALGMSPAHADPLEMILSGNGSGLDLSIFDGSAGDDDLAVNGSITYSGTFQGWSFGAGLVGVDLSTPGAAKLRLFGAATDDGIRVDQSLMIELISSALTSPSLAGASALTVVSGAGAPDFVEYETFFNAIEISDILSVGGGTVAYGGLDASNPFYLSHAASIDHSGEGQTTSFDMVTTVTVPEPAALGLFGFGLLGLGFARRRNAA